MLEVFALNPATIRTPHKRGHNVSDPVTVAIKKYVRSVRSPKHKSNFFAGEEMPVGLYNPKRRAVRRPKGTLKVKPRGVHRKGGWGDDPKGHSIAAFLGRHGRAGLGQRAPKAGLITPAVLAAHKFRHKRIRHGYRAGSPTRALGKVASTPKFTFGFKGRKIAWNRGKRRAGRYAKFVQSFARRSGLTGPALMKAAGRAWRGGSRRNEMDLVGTNRSNPYMYSINRGMRRRNPYMYSINRGKRRHNPLAALQSGFATVTNVNTWTDQVLPLASGYILSGVIGWGVGSKVIGMDYSGIGKHLMNVGGAILGTAAISYIRPQAAGHFLAGGLARVLVDGLLSLIAPNIDKVVEGASKSLPGMADFAAADELTDELKRRISGKLAARMSDYGSVQSIATTDQLADFATASQVEQGPRLAGPGVSNFLGDGSIAYSPEDVSTVADLSMFSDTMADAALV